MVLAIPYSCRDNNIPVPKISYGYDKVKNLIKKYESFSETPYPDTDGTMLIGYGFRNTGLKRITEQQADSMLDEQIRSLDSVIVLRYPNLERPEQLAFISFFFNTGINYFSNRKAGIHECMKFGDKDCIRERLLHYTKAEGKVLRGLIERRKAEVLLMDEPT